MASCIGGDYIEQVVHSGWRQLPQPNLRVTQRTVHWVVLLYHLIVLLQITRLRLWLS